MLSVLAAGHVAALKRLNAGIPVGLASGVVVHVVVWKLAVPVMAVQGPTVPTVQPLQQSLSNAISWVQAASEKISVLAKFVWAAAWKAKIAITAMKII